MRSQDIQKHPQLDEIHRGTVQAKISLQNPCVENDMDLLDDFDFDPEEVIRHTDGGPLLDSAPVVGSTHMVSSAGERPNEFLQRSEGDFNAGMSLDGRLVDSFDDFDDFDEEILIEAIQHAPRNFDHQDPSQGRHGIDSKHTNNTAFDKGRQYGEEIIHQAPCSENYIESPSGVGKFSQRKVLPRAERRAGVQATPDDQNMNWKDTAAVDKAISKEQDTRSPQLPEQPWMSSRHDGVTQELTRDDRDDASHQYSMYEVTKEPSMQTSNGPSREWAPANESDEDSTEARALSEAIQYAYENYLTTDYLLSSFSITHLFGPLVQRTFPMTNNDGLTDHSHLPDAEIPNPLVLDKSKTLTITPCALNLIAEARSVHNEEAVQSLTDEVCNPDKFKPKKLELPILRTDNDRDLRAFRQRRLTRSDTLLRSIKEHRLPLYPQSLEDGEGMELSSRARADSEMMMKRSEEEKVGVTSTILTYLVSQLKDDYTLDDQMQYMMGEINYDKARASLLPLVCHHLLTGMTIGPRN